MKWRVRSDLPPRSAAGRPRESAGSHRADLGHLGCWWPPSHPARHMHRFAPLAPLYLVFPPLQWASGDFTRQRLSSGRESSQDLSEGNPQEPLKSAEQQTTWPQNPTFELGSQLAPWNSQLQQTLHCTISLRKPPKLPLGRQVPWLEPCSS